eukprot:1117167-Rhodomonas_salina.1
MRMFVFHFKVRSCNLHFQTTLRNLVPKACRPRTVSTRKVANSGYESMGLDVAQARSSQIWTATLTFAVTFTFSSASTLRAQAVGNLASSNGSSMEEQRVSGTLDPSKNDKSGSAFECARFINSRSSTIDQRFSVAQFTAGARPDGGASLMTPCPGIEMHS